ncbi:SRR1-like protein [Tiliqua scincoides]|uniref:SRR1-like protein n=1 Tax=Tiliqua scincoides TaxID=71010 RepID=UPI003462CE9D
MERRGGAEEEAAWRAPGSGRRRRRRRGAARGAEEAGRLARARLREARAELLASEFWESSLKVILQSLRKQLAPPKEMSALTTAEKTLSALENLQLTPAAEPALESISRPREEPESYTSGLQCVCYGIGNFSSSVQSRYQLAFLLLLLKKLKIPENMCEVFDPVFSTVETDILNSLGVTVLSENEEGKRHVHNPTLFYMIHCGKALYNNLLWSNWSMEGLSNLVVIGNSFRGIEERLLAKIFQRDYGYIAKVLRATEEEALPAHPHYLDIFNDTSIHCFPGHKLVTLPLETWGVREEPVYQDDDRLEIIRKQ